MNISRKRINDNTFVVTTDRNEEITYYFGKPISDFDISTFIFTENEIEYNIKKITKLYKEIKKIRLNQVSLQVYLKNINEISKEIKSRRNDIERLNARKTALIEDNAMVALSRKRINNTKKLTKKI